MNENIITAAEITPDYIAAQQEKWKAAANAEHAAASAYLEDLDTRKAALAKQEDAYNAELDKLNTARKELSAKINDLSSRGLIDAAAEVDAELESLDKSITSIERKLRLVSAAELKGDPKLYRAAKAAHEAAEVERSPYREKIDELKSLVAAEIKRLEIVKRELQYAKDRDPGYYAAQAFAKVDRHFRDLDRAEREAAEKAAAERRAAEAARGSVHYVLT